MENKKEGFRETSTAIDEGMPSVPSTIKSIEQCGSSINEEKNFEIRYNPRSLSLKTVTMNDLYEQVFTERPPVIEGLLYPGTYLFAGAPKLGKSFLMMEFAYHVANGKNLWGCSVKQGTVLYLALEDDERRLQDRLYRMFGMECTENLHLATRSFALYEGLIGQLHQFYLGHPDTSLMIIDTLQKIKNSAEDKYSYANDYELIAHLKEFTDLTGICLLLVHHTRKQQADDRFEMISGTNGLLGAADGAFILHKDSRVSAEAILDISGRDQPDETIYLNRNPVNLLWEMIKVEVETFTLPQEPILDEIAKIVTEEKPIWNGTATELVEQIKTDIHPNNITKILNVNATRLLNVYGIQYQNRRTHEGRCITFVKNY